jgi:hypothetical protein
MEYVVGFPRNSFLWLLNQHELALLRGGQFAPVYPGQFTPVLGDQFAPAELVSLFRFTMVTFTGIFNLQRKPPFKFQRK